MVFCFETFAYNTAVHKQKNMVKLQNMDIWTLHGQVKTFAIVQYCTQNVFCSSHFDFD